MYLTTHKLSKLPTYELPQFLSWTDASSSGAAAVIVKGKTTVASVLNFTKAEIQIRAVELGIQAFSGHMEGKIVKFFCDNKGCVAILTNGCKLKHLHCLAMRIFSNMLSHQY